MGLLDDAIREHLELKRRRGADPGEVAREQLEALDAPYEPRAVDEQAAGLEADGHDDSIDEEHFGGAGDPVGGETAELDMEAVLAEDREPVEAVAEEDSLEWEMPERARAPHHEEAPSSAGEVSPRPE